MRDRPHLPSIELSIQAEDVDAADGSIPLLPVSGFRRERLRYDFPHRGNDGAAKGRPLQSSPACAAHPGGPHRIRAHADPGPVPSRRRLHADDANVPRSRLGLSLSGDARWIKKAGLSRPVFAGDFPEANSNRRGDVHPLRSDGPSDVLGAAGSEKVDLSGLKMVVGGSALPSSLARAAMARGIDVFSGYGL